MSEGLDFKNIRQVHIIEPWYNLSRHSQIIGRAIRKNSHINLPDEEQNVEVFEYCAHMNSKTKLQETETVDLRIYRNAELKNIATSFSTIVEGMDTRFFENTTEFHFPDKTYYYNVSISTEYVIVSAEGNQNNKLSIKERFIVKPWPRTSDQTWKTGEELHNYCLYTYGHSGTILDPIVQADLDELNIYKENAGIYLVSNPLYFKINKPVYIEKVIIYYGIAEKQDFLLIYQLE